ncbi:DUF3293 domain-containing protein [Celerinatantimonas diazotrophica]|uniref:Uncharacterized protein DUF3293 n=1 Tax=Celerinatantimonas diazotrophica TaxID=412034 RepID=A0A4R1K201_9GAMM|nr:DUF3293 domain-containing protein [Celerinatantimonas diazotrophica]TCK58034.1 uncharacterized protein DUF3293 [Celerinatantimonas diazotrophica]CAG9297897.1 hypothetical protein CEDIAZO_03089 [Celerinatantimonas diazotrophica]
MKESYIKERYGSHRQLFALWANSQWVDFVSLSSVPRFSGSIITASNPMGNIYSKNKNHRFNLWLASALIHRHCHFITLWGAAKDNSHAELSFYCQLTPLQSLMLARRFHQLAIYTVNKRAEVKLLSCVDSAQFSHLGTIQKYWHRSPRRYLHLRQRF